MRTTIVEVLSGVFARPVDQFGDDTGPAAVPGWDSAKHVELVVALEDRFGCVFEPDEVAELTSLRRIEEILRRHGCE